MIGLSTRLRQMFGTEPYLWFQYCFFQPIGFEEAFETSVLRERLLMMLKLTPLIFLYSYPPALITRILALWLKPDLYSYYHATPFVPLNPGMVAFLWDATWTSALSCLVVGLFGGIFAVRIGIALAFAASLANGIIVLTGSNTWVGIIFGIAFGLLLGISFNSAHAMKYRGIEHVPLAGVCGVIAGIIVGFLTGTFEGYWAGYIVALWDPTLRPSIAGNVAGVAVGTISAGILMYLITLAARKYMHNQRELVQVAGRISVMVACLFGGAVGITVGDEGIRKTLFPGWVGAGLAEVGILSCGFVIFYLLSYYRLPLYPISAYSMIRAYLANKSGRQQTLYYLCNSSLHWDECVFLRLPYLKTLLLSAAEQDLEGVLSEINFIVQERPQQHWAAQAVAYELALRDLQGRKVLRDIGQAYTRLAAFLPWQTRGLSASADSVFRNLEDASREAASYYTQTNNHDRQQALGRMVGYLDTIRTHTTFNSEKLNSYLQVVVSQWRMLAEQGKDTLASTAQYMPIENPYAPGSPLEPRDPLFVGRDDIVQKLGRALQQRYRPAFLLTGERRMGKSSTIKQLPVLLGPRYLPVFYDLQTPGMLASAASFFSTLAAGIERQLREREVVVEKLPRGQLDEAQRRSEAAVYDRFDRWLQEIEQVLEQDDRILILEFDEFEKLEDAEERKSMDLRLLLDWCRSMIQNRPRVALLFSGARMGGDMGRSWASYFVNVEVIKVSFLREADAYRLIASPVPHIFPEATIQEIMRVTRGHPFLVQALCKQLIEVLNDHEREQATIEDVAVAIPDVFQSWLVYFWDLWDRCDADQQACVLALEALETGSMSDIIQRSALGREHALYALEKLQLRDIVTADQNRYHIAVPMFAQWIRQNRHLLAPSAEGPA